MKKLLTSHKLMQSMAASLAILSFATAAKATPFASCITNTSGTISFFLNEPGSAVTVTYEDGSTNASFNGVTTSTNVAAGITNFALGSHTSYSISVSKTGSGVPSQITNRAISSTGGVAVNTIATSPYFGHVYDVQRQAGVWLMNADLSLVKSTVQTAGIGFPVGAGSSTYPSPDWVSIAPDSSVMVSDESLPSAAVYQMKPDFSSAQLFLGPLGATNSVHGSIISSVILLGAVSNGNAQLFTVDGDLGNPGSIQYYNIGAGPLPYTTPPTYQGAQISLAGYTVQALGGNPYVGFTRGTNGYIYGSTYRGSPGSAPFVTITDATGTNILWLSTTNSPPTGDWFYQTASAAGPIGISSSAVSPDGKYLVGLSVESYLIVAPLTNGIPNTAAIFTINAGASGTTYENGRGISWDAADNIVVSSSGFGTVATYSLGSSGTAVTTGTAAGTTGFTLTQPSTSISVVATTPNASQGGVNGTVGTPIPGVFNIYRYSTNGYANAQTVNYILTGTATVGSTNVYTVLSTNSVIIPAGQTNVTVTINPTTNNVPRTTTTVILSIAGGSGYSTAAPFSDTVYIQNTSSQLLYLTSGAPSMYKAFSNDYASVVIHRLGDTNAAAYTVSSYTYAGTAVLGTDFTAATSVTFNPGVVTNIATISPLVAGQLPVDTNNSVYTGNKSTTLTLVAATGYTVSNSPISLTLIDNADPTTAVLFSDALNDPTDAANYSLTYANSDMANIPNTDYDVTFGFDLTDSGNQGLVGLIGFPPNGNSKVLRMTVNKDVTPGASAGVNVYPTNVSFSGNFAVRFYMNLVQGSSLSVATEGALFGINHNGQETNWWTGSGINSYNGYTNWAADGVWYWLDSDAGGAASGDYIGFLGGTNAPPSPSNTGWIYNFTGLFYTSYENQFKTNVYTTDSNSGLPANESSFTSLTGAAASSWADVEIKQIKGVITLSVNKTIINTYTNTTIYTNGTVMLGYDDPFSSVGSADGSVYYSGLRVVSIGAPFITGISVVPGSTTNVVINFTTTDGDDTISSFNLLGSNPTNSVANLVDTATTATFTQLGSGAFQAVTAMPTNKVKFYRIQHK